MKHDFTVGESVRLRESKAAGQVVGLKPDDVKVLFDNGRALWFPPSMLEPVS